MTRYETGIFPPLEGADEKELELYHRAELAKRGADISRKGFRKAERARKISAVSGLGQASRRRQEAADRALIRSGDDGELAFQALKALSEHRMPRSASEADFGSTQREIEDLPETSEKNN